MSLYLSPGPPVIQSGEFKFSLRIPSLELSPCPCRNRSNFTGSSKYHQCALFAVREWERKIGRRNRQTLNHSSSLSLSFSPNTCSFWLICICLLVLSKHIHTFTKWYQNGHTNRNKQSMCTTTTTCANLSRLLTHYYYRHIPKKPWAENFALSAAV